MPANFFMLIGYTIFSFYLELICTHKFFQKAKNVLTEAASGKRLVFFFFFLFIYLLFFLAINLLFYKHSNNINKSTHTHTHNADTSNWKRLVQFQLFEKLTLHTNS